MSTQTATTSRFCGVLAAIALLLVGLGSAPPALAGITLNTIDAEAITHDAGGHLVVIVTGPLQCDAGERVLVRVTVTQRSTGAVAVGSRRLRCTGAVQRWEVHAVPRGDAVFAEGDATVTAMARTTLRGDATDAHQWLRPVTLLPY